MAFDPTGGNIMDMTLPAGIDMPATTNPATLPLTIALALLPGLFQKRFYPYNQMVGALGQPPRRYDSPYLGQMDPAVMRAVMAQMNRTLNWGWPEGLQASIAAPENPYSGFHPAKGGF